MRAIQWLSPSPVKDYGERTIMYVPERNASEPNRFLIDVAIKSITRAQDISLADLGPRQGTNAPDYPEVWPGEHYRLLAAIVAVLQPLTVVEIGTYRGLSALALKKFLPSEGKITTFDIVSWDQLQGTCLNASDFADGRLDQRLGDLTDPLFFSSHSELFRNAQLIFLDAPKDGIFERRFIEHLSKVDTACRKLLVFDDIRTWNMLAIWRAITFPKLDLTSFGHWTGTGLVDWNSVTDQPPGAHSTS